MTWRSRVSVSFAGFTGLVCLHRRVRAGGGGGSGARRFPSPPWPLRGGFLRRPPRQPVGRGLGPERDGVARPLVAPRTTRRRRGQHRRRLRSLSPSCPGRRTPISSPRGGGGGRRWGRAGERVSGGRGGGTGRDAGRDRKQGRCASRLCGKCFARGLVSNAMADARRGNAARSCCCNDSLLRFVRDARAARPVVDARAAELPPERAPSRDRATPRRATSACRRGRRARARVYRRRALGLARVFNFDVFKFKCPACRGERWNRRPTVCRGFKIPDRSEEAFFFSG